MRIIIDCDPEHLEKAAELAIQQAPHFETRYDRMGWGHTFNNFGVRLFVRRIKNGISLKQVG